MSERIYFQIEADSHKKRLDDFLFDKFHSLSKTYLRERLKEGNCEVNGFEGNAGIKLKTDDFIEIELDLRRETAMKPEAIPLEIVYEEDSFLVVNKQAEMLVHPTHRDKNGTLLNALSYYLNSRFKIQDSGFRIQDSRFKIQDSGFKIQDSRLENPQSAIRNPQSKIIRPGLIHRLDKKTSGLIVISKNVRTHQILAKRFEKRQVEKKYLALVEGVLKEDSGEIVAPIGRFAELKHWSVKEDGKRAETRFRVIERFAETTLLELEPVTGRTNQLRIHCEFFGHPIVGDSTRGGREFRRLCLHAYKLAFQHPHEKRRLEFVAELSEDFM